MSTLYKVKDHPHLVKDMDSKAVLNTNYAALLEYKKQKQTLNDVESLKNDVKEIKQLLGELLGKLNK
jgi:hypothetical protein